MHTAKTAITHHQHMIARLRHLAHRCHQLAEIVEGGRLGAQRRQRFGSIPAQLVGIAEHLIGPGDSLIIPGGVTHGCRCLEAGELIDTFTPRLASLRASRALSSSTKSSSGALVTRTSLAASRSGGLWRSSGSFHTSIAWSQ